jgi:Glycosyl transferase family 2
VNRFFFVDNGSSDGTLDYLIEQPDAHVFSTEGHLKEANAGATWLNTLLAQFGVGSWCVTVDIDELLYYPGSEHAPLPVLTAYLDHHGCEALPALLLDLYPPGPIAECPYTPGDDLLAAAPYFDRGPYKHQPFTLCPYVMIVGGPRERLFSSDARGDGPNRRRLRRSVMRIYQGLARRLPILRRSPWFHALRPRRSPCLTKVPLVKWDDGSKYLAANHFVSPKRLPPETGVLMHFKFLGDFHAKALQEAVRGEYFDGASEYKGYAESVTRNPRLTLMYEGSVRFRDTAQLVALGLMQDSPAWKAAR